MMPQSDLMNTALGERGIQASPAQFGAQGAGILLPALFKHDLIDRHLYPLIGHLQLFAQRRHRRKIHAGHPHLQGNGLQSERDRVKPAQLRQGHQRQQAVLPAADTYGKAVVGRDHTVVLHASADKPQNMLHEKILQN